MNCFEKAELAGALFCGGIDAPGGAEENVDALEKAYAFGRDIL